MSALETKSSPAVPMNVDSKVAASAPVANSKIGETKSFPTAAPTAAPTTATAAANATAAATGLTGSGVKYTGLHSFEIYGRKFTVDSKYMPKRPIGRGAYGVVCSCVDQETGRRVAIKQIPELFRDLVDAKRILREIKVLRHLNGHENVIKLFDLIEPPEHAPFESLYMVFELMDVDLTTTLRNNRYELTDEHTQYFVYQMLRGLKYVHSANVLHRDLKPGNLLLNADCKLKICDFGLARGVKADPAVSGGKSNGPDYELTEYVVTRWYRAPEVMCNSHHYDYKRMSLHHTHTRTFTHSCRGVMC